MANVGKSYPDEIAQLKRIKEILRLTNADLCELCVDFCGKNPRYTPPCMRTIDKVYADGSEKATFSLSVIQTLTAVSTYLEQAHNAKDAESNAAIAEQAQLLRITVERKNAKIEELEAKISDLENQKQYLKEQYDRVMKIVEALTSKQ